MEKTKKTRFHVSDKWFWIKISGFLLFLMYALITIVAFVGQDLKVYYGSDIEGGFGIFALMAAWISSYSSIESKSKKSWIKNIISLGFIVTALALSPSLLSIIFGSLACAFVITTGVYKFMNPEDIPHTLKD